MAANLTMVRIATKLDDLFNEKIDISDVKTSDDDRSTFYSRAIAALSIMIQCGIDETLSVSCVTDGYHDMGIDAVYNDSTQKKLVLVQSKWRRDGTGGISQEEAGSFAQGVKRIINSEFEGCNAKISKRYYEQNQRSFSIITTELNSYAVKSQEKRHIVLIELRGCLRLKEYHW